MKTMTKNKLLLLHFFCSLNIVFFFFASACFAEQTSQPIQIEADRMESNQDKSTVTFTGKVEARQADLIIYADEITVNYQKPSADKNQSAMELAQINKFTATGNIKIVKEGWIATGDNVEYFEKERKVILTGNAKILQDNNMITGNRVIYFLDQGKSIVEHKDGRVKGFFYPDTSE